MAQAIKPLLERKTEMTTQTLTSRQRTTQPRKFAKRDARTMCYRIVCGPGGTRNVHPLRDPTRTAPSFDSPREFDAAKAQLLDLLPVAKFPTDTIQQLVKRLNEAKPAGATSFTLLAGYLQ